MKETKILLNEKEIPRYWYNIQADMPNPLKPPLSPTTGNPATPDELGAIFPDEVIKQEVSVERYIEIPEKLGKYISCGGLHLYLGHIAWKSFRYTGKDLF